MSVERLPATKIALKAGRRVTSFDVEATVNAADDVVRGDVFLTVTGTSAEAGDDGKWVAATGGRGS